MSEIILSERLLDPRTLQEVLNPADCHLIPKVFGVSHAPIRLNAEIDNKIGSFCDSELVNYFEMLLGKRIRGRVEIVEGAKSLSAVLATDALVIAVPKPRGGTSDDFLQRALAVKDGSSRWEKFESIVVDNYSAQVSILHSAFLTLYSQLPEAVFDARCNWIRDLFAKAISKDLQTTDMERLFGKIKIYFGGPNIKNATYDISELRNEYDPDFVLNDGLYENFPANSVRYENGNFVVVLPYSRNLRAQVTISY